MRPASPCIATTTYGAPLFSPAKTRRMLCSLAKLQSTTRMDFYFPPARPEPSSGLPLVPRSPWSVTGSTTPRRWPPQTSTYSVRRSEAGPHDSTSRAASAILPCRPSSRRSRTKRHGNIYVVAGRGRERGSGDPQRGVIRATTATDRSECPVLSGPESVCLELAWEAAAKGSNPVGAVLLDSGGRVIVRARSRIRENRVAHPAACGEPSRARGD